LSSATGLTNETEPVLERGAGAREACTAVVQLLAPVAPFIAEELWRETLGNAESVHKSSWPVFDPALANMERVTLVVQIDGKVRDRLDVSAELSDAECERLGLESSRVQEALDG